MKSFFKLLEKTAGPIGLLTATAGAILDFLTPLGNYIYLLAAILLVLTVLTAICSKSNPILQKVKKSTSFAPDFIKNELVELWQPDGVAFWKKGLFQVLTFLTALSLGAGVYAKDNPNGFLATKIDSVASLQTNLGLIDSKLGNISAKQDKIIEVIEKTDKKIDLVKKETSDNPRKELANLGVSWDEDSFMQSIMQNDKNVFDLFIAGGFKLEDKEDPYNYFVYEMMKNKKDFSLLHEAINNGSISKNIFIKYKLGLSVSGLNNLDQLMSQLDLHNAEIDKKYTQDYIQRKRSTIINPPNFLNDEKVKPLLIAIWSKNQNAVNFILSLENKNQMEKEVIYADNKEEYKNTEFITSFELSTEDEARKNNIRLN